MRGTRPVLVTFESFKDRDEVLRKVNESYKVFHNFVFFIGKVTKEGKHSC